VPGTEANQIVKAFAAAANAFTVSGLDCCSHGAVSPCPEVMLAKNASTQRGGYNHAG
jgi:hypothetical protein